MSDVPVRQKHSGTHAGVPFMVVGTLFGAGMVVIAKELGDSYSVVQIVWFRYLVHMAVVALVFGPSLKTRLVTTNLLSVQLARSVLILGTTTLYFLAVLHMPVAEAAAITYIAPLVTVFLAGRLLNEGVGRRAALAAAIGFAGVVAVIQPFSGRFGMAVLLPLGAALSSSFYLMMTRLIGWRDSAPTTLFYTGSVGLVVSTLAVPFFWIRPATVTDLALLILLGVLGGVGHFLFIKAHQHSTASSLAPLGYLELGFVTLMGLMFFGEFPNSLSFLGMALIVIAGVVVANRGNSPGTRLVET